MLHLLWFVLKIAFRLKVVVLSVAAGMALATGLQQRQLSRTWGLLPGDGQRTLPGDDLVVTPGITETRSLIIAATPAQVWPWIVQIGYGRGGWYSFTPLDRAWRPGGGSPRRSAARILPEYQGLAAGDIVPTHPGGGFEARIVEPERALVVYLDDKMVREQALAEAARHPEIRAQVARDVEMPAFRVSWAFILQAEPLGGTRLVERVRADIDLAGPQRRGLPVLGVGLFTLLRSQMLGIQRRAEGASRRSA